MPTIYEDDGNEQLTVDACEEFTLQWGHPHEIGDDSQRCEAVIAKMDEGSRLDRHRILVWLMPSLGSISCSKDGCHVAQKAVELALGADRKALLEALQPHITDLYKSPFGNFVLSKVVEVMPSAMLGCIVEAFVGRATAIARHRYGCRIIERLIEHCDANQISGLLDEIVADAEGLSQHNCGNFVVQRVLEHGASAQVTEIKRQLCIRMDVISQHRFGSHVVECAIGCSDEAGQDVVVKALLDDCDLISLACSRFGSVVVERLADLRMSRDIVKQRLVGGQQTLEASRFGKRVLEAFHLTVAATAIDACK